MCYQNINTMNLLIILMENTEVIACRKKQLEEERKTKTRKKAAVYISIPTKSWEWTQWLK